MKTNKSLKTITKAIILSLPFIAYLIHLISAYKLNEVYDGLTRVGHISENLELFYFSSISSAIAILLVSFNAVFGINNHESVGSSIKRFFKEITFDRNRLLRKAVLIPISIIIALLLLTGIGVSNVINTLPYDVNLLKKLDLLISPYATIIAILMFALIAIFSTSSSEVGNGEISSYGLIKRSEILRKFPITLGLVNGFSLMALWVFSFGSLSVLFLDSHNWFNWQLPILILLGSFTALTSIHDIYFRKTLTALALVIISNELNLSWLLGAATGIDITSPDAFLSDEHLAHLAAGHIFAFGALTGSLFWVSKTLGDKWKIFPLSFRHLIFSVTTILLQYGVSVNSVRHLDLIPHIESLEFNSITLTTKEIDQTVFDFSKFQFKKIHQSNYQESIGLKDDDLGNSVATYLNNKGYDVTKEDVMKNKAILSIFDSLVLYKNLLKNDVGYTRTVKMGKGDDKDYRYVDSFALTVITYYIAEANEETFLKTIPVLTDALRRIAESGKFGEGYIDAHEHATNMLYAIEKNDKNRFWSIYSSNLKLADAVPEISKLAYRVSLINGWEPPKEIETHLGSAPKKETIKVGDVDVPNDIYKSAIAEVNANRLLKYAPKLKLVIEEDARKTRYCGLNPFNC